MLRYFLFIVQYLSAVALAYQISKLKCQIYQNMIDAGCEDNPVPLIVGGEKVEGNEFPHMALIGFGEENPVYECGGSLISEHYVLTAAHCASSKENGAASAVIMGMSNRSYEGEYKQKRNISKIIMHPKYIQSSKYHDIALLELQEPAIITEHVRPGCLNFEAEDLINQTSVAIGFGKTSFTEDTGSEELNKVTLPIINNTECERFFKNMKRTTLKQGLIKEMLCAGTLKGGKDTCQGDSGGPLHIYMPPPYCTYILIGITSFGKFCGYAKSPAIYTNIYQYVPWIEKHVWGDDTI